MNIMAGQGVAVREFQLTTGEADYGLYIDGKVAGVIEAKKTGSTLTGVETQTDKYAKGLPDGVPHYGLPLPFGYESTGVVTRFTNRLNPFPRSREVFTFHRPEELKSLLDIGDKKSSDLDCKPCLSWKTANSGRFSASPSPTLKNRSLRTDLDHCVTAKSRSWPAACRSNRFTSKLALPVKPKCFTRLEKFAIIVFSR